MPPKRARLENGEESEMAESIEEIMKNQKEILQKIDKLSKTDGKEIANNEFVMKRSFSNVLEMGEGDSKSSASEQHFGLKWFIHIKRDKDYLVIYLAVLKSSMGKECFIETGIHLELVVENKDYRGQNMMGSMGKHGNACATKQLISWDDMKNNFLKDNKIEVKARVKVLKMAGAVKQKVFDFGEANKEHSDVVLKVGNEKFYVLKGFLSRRSRFFTALFSNKFKEGQQNEIELPETDAQDFQNFLEVLHGDAKPDDFTVGGILLLNDKYNDNNVRRECEEFLMEKSTKPLAEKLQLSSRFQLDLLTEKCVSDIKDKEEYKKILQEVLGTLNLTVSTALHAKSMTFL